MWTFTGSSLTNLNGSNSNTMPKPILKTPAEIQARIAEIESSHSHVLTGELSTIVENAPRALMQLSAETQLRMLNWCLGKEFKSKLKKRDAR